MKIKKIFKSWQVILLIVLLVASVIVINFNPTIQGSAIRAVRQGSAAEIAGLRNPDSSSRPTDREIIVAVDGQVILSANDYFEKTRNLEINQTVTIKTNKNTYQLIVQPKVEEIFLDETEFVQREQFDEELGEFVNVTLEVQKVITNVLGPEDLGLVVYNAPTSNINQGLDLQGGTRIIIEPAEEITNEQYDQIKSNLEQRLNSFGLSDVTVSVINNFQFQPQYILIEIAGTTVEEIEEFVLSQGEFVAVIGNTTVFRGEDRDVAYVGKGPTESRVEQCFDDATGSVCRFSFDIRLTPSAAQRMAKVTSELDVIPGSNSQDGYLSEQIVLYLDGRNISSLNIAASLKGEAATQIRISGSGSGINRMEAIEAARMQMKTLQTVIETGSLPTSLVIVKSDTISPVLGQNFINNAILVGLLALLTVVIVLGVRYRRFIVVIPIGLALVFEVILIMGAYAAFGWTMDLAAIAGIIIVLGTGVDHLVVITDEVLRKSVGYVENWKAKTKRAFSIIIGAFLTTTFAMLPLLIAGAGLLKGFAITTLTGLFVGVLLVRPTYGKVLEILQK